MYNDLLVMTFKGMEDALIAWIGLYMLREKTLLGLDTTTMVFIDETGRANITQSWDMAAYPKSVTGRLPGYLAHTLNSDKTGRGQQRLANAGLDARFLQELMEAMTPNSSALLFYTPHDSLVDTQRLRDALSQLRGKLFHTTIPTVVADTIIKQEWCEVW